MLSAGAVMLLGGYEGYDDTNSNIAYCDAYYYSIHNHSSIYSYHIPVSRSCQRSYMEFSPRRMEDKIDSR